MRRKRPSTDPAGVSSAIKDGLCPAPKPLKPLVPVRTKNVEEHYHPRPDATSHYPFTDAKASAESILTAPSPVPHIFTIGVPQRKRLAQRIYSESCQTAAGLRVAEIPSALAQLGIVVPRSIERAFLARSLLSEDEANADARKSPDDNGNGDSASPSFKPAASHGLTVDQVVSCEQWLLLVDKYIDRERQFSRARNNARNSAPSRGYDAVLEEHAHVPDADQMVAELLAAAAPIMPIIESMLPKSVEYAWPMEQPDDADEEVMSEDDGVLDQTALEDVAFQTALGRSLIHAKSRLHRTDSMSKAPKDNRTKPDMGDFESAYHKKLRKDLYGTAPRRRDVARAPIVVKTNRAHRLRAVQSRIGADVYRDKRRYQQNRELQTSSAMTAIAKQRIAELGLDVEGGISGPRTQKTGFDPSSSHLVGNTLNDSGSLGLPSTMRDPRGRYADLDSGTAAGAIAEAFMHSRVGQQFMLDPQDSNTFSLREAATAQWDNEEENDLVQKEVAYLLGGLSADKSESTTATHGYVSVKERYMASKVEQATGKALYKGWKEAKGGMVADYGRPKSRR